MKNFTEFKLNDEQALNTIGKGRPDFADQPDGAGTPDYVDGLPEGAQDVSDLTGTPDFAGTPDGLPEPQNP